VYFESFVYVTFCTILRMSYRQTLVDKIMFSLGISWVVNVSALVISLCCCLVVASLTVVRDRAGTIVYL